MASPTSSPSLSRAPSGFRNLPNKYALFSPRLVFTTLSPKDASLGPYAHPTTGKPMHLFTLDDSMHYTPFKNDHGPLNLAYTFEACVRIYEKMNASEYKRRALCLYTSPEPQSKSNMALIAALFNLIVEHSDPWDAFQPIAHMELLPFRDAGNGKNEFGLSAQDVLYGVWKAGHNDLLRLPDFDAEEYRWYERVENGDLNIVGPFIPFASPQDPAYIKSVTPSGQVPIEYSSSQQRMLRSCFEKVKKKFEEEEVGLVVRLNEDLYDDAEFTDMGIQHVDMYFDDGTNPTDDIVREFIKRAERVIEHDNKKVAVHCKAGLGRTGVLIGAYLIYKHNFTATEAIGFMRLIRPGMVVGPQQRYMQLNQLKWAGWAAVDAAREQDESNSNALPTPPLEVSHLNGLLLSSESRPLTPTRRLPPLTLGDAIGQPRKGPNGRRAVVESKSPESATPARNVKSDAPSPPTDRSSPGGSIRGTKRGSGRAPVPIRAETMPQLGVPSSSALVRSTSTISCNSTASELDQRATKRHLGDASPLSKTGLSSPPPSREVTPDEDPFPLSQLSDSDTPSTPPRSSSTIASLTPISPDRELPRQRSLIPRRPMTYEKHHKSRSASHGDGSVSDSELPSGATPRSKPQPISRHSLSSPRIWSSMARVAIAGPPE